MENNPNFQDSLAVEHPDSSSRRSYLPVYIAVFFLIVVLIVVTGVLMNRPNFLKKSSKVVLVPNNDMSAICGAYSTTYPLKDGFGVYSAGLVTVGNATYCEIVLVGTLVTVNENVLQLVIPGKLQNVSITYEPNVELYPANNFQTFPNEFYSLSVYEKLQRFKNVMLGVTIKVKEDGSFFATEISVGGRVLNNGDVKTLETTVSTQP